MQNLMKLSLINHLKVQHSTSIAIADGEKSQKEPQQKIP